MAIALLSLLIPFLAQGGSVVGEAGSVTARAAQNVDAPGDELFPADGPAFAAAQRLAVEHWGADACNGEVVTRWADLDEGTNATASWRNPSDAWNNAGENFDCIVELNTRADYTFRKLCTVLAHELGHLLGNPHAEVDGVLMSAMYSGPLPACAAADPAADAPETDPAAASAATLSSAARKPAARPAAKRKRVLKTSARRRCVRRFSDGKRAKRCVAPKKKRAAAKRSRARR